MSNGRHRRELWDIAFDYAVPVIFVIAVLLAVFGMILIIQGALTAGTVLLVWAVITTFAGVGFLVLAR